MAFPSSSSSVAFAPTPGLVRRKTSAAAAYGHPSHIASSAGMRPSKSVSGNRTRTLSRLSDDEREREKEMKREQQRRPAAYRRFEEVARASGSTSRLRGGEASSSSEDLAARRAGVAGLVRSKSKREVEKRLREEERRRLEERGCLSDPEGGGGAGDEADDSDDDVEEPQPWGLSQELKLCEVSAKDGQGRGSERVARVRKTGLTVAWPNLGVEDLFQDLLQMIISRRETIEKERQARERDSVMLSVPTRVPTWGALGEEDEDSDDDARAPATRKSGWGSCCGI